MTFLKKSDMLYLTSLWNVNFQRVCEKKIKIIIKEVKVLKGYLNNSCKGKGNDKVKFNAHFHICVNW